MMCNRCGDPIVEDRYVTVIVHSDDGEAPPAYWCRDCAIKIFHRHDHGAICEASSSYGTLVFDKETGEVLEVWPDLCDDRPYLYDVERVDVQEYRDYYGHDLPSGVDICDLRLIMQDGSVYEAEYREEA